jgi:phosphatidate cytidylyltransferase
MSSVLKQRIITGVILAVSLIAAVVYLSIFSLALVLAAVVIIAAWEWSALAGYQRTGYRLFYVVAMAAGMAGLYHFCQLGAAPTVDKVQPFLGLACLWWAIALLWIKGFPGSASLWGTPAMLNLMGLLVLLPPWLAVVYLLHYDSGRVLLLAMIVVVAFADIGAYFSGKAWGRRKLALAVSPGKSWEGFWGGLATCIGLGLIAGFGFLPPQLSIIGLLAIVVFTALASVVGDLLESMVKRHRGVKDSGILLPGHGGFLDRIDGITAAAPVFALGLILAGWYP